MRGKKILPYVIALALTPVVGHGIKTCIETYMSVRETTQSLSQINELVATRKEEVARGDDELTERLKEIDGVINRTSEILREIENSPKIKIERLETLAKQNNLWTFDEFMMDYFQNNKLPRGIRDYLDNQEPYEKFPKSVELHLQAAYREYVEKQVEKEKTEPGR